ncbi:MAG: glutamate racemase [Bacteroidota bacterium]|jgi:glutamate racemase
MQTKKPIGVFDSGYGGLTILKELQLALPTHDFIYLGDNARAPYGPRSYDTVYQYTLEAVDWLFAKGCDLVILACNTASAKALRTIQQKDLASRGSHKRVLGVIRPTTEVLGQFSSSKQVGIVGTKGTVESESYPTEIAKFFPDVKVFQQACPMWVPLIENRAYNTPGARYFIEQDLDSLFAQSAKIDTLLLGCTHYPLLLQTIESLVPKGVKVLTQGAIVAASLVDYLKRHPDLDAGITKHNDCVFYTTDATSDFDAHAADFLGYSVQSLPATL